MAKEICYTCKYNWTETISDSETNTVMVRDSECRRRAPVLIGTSDRSKTAWPKVCPEEWCGEYEKSELFAGRGGE